MIATEKEPIDSRQRLSALDGIRGLAILMVLAHHGMKLVIPHSAAWRYFGQFGWTGVDLFFVLSGFLITGILVDTRESNHYYARFYYRRTLRIFPLYYAFLFTVFVLLSPLLSGDAAYLKLSGLQAWFWTYLQNWPIGLTGKWTGFAYMDVLWSLAVEEQFYLLWPFVVSVTPPRRLLMVCLAVIALAIASRIALAATGFSPDASYCLTPCRADSLVVGAAIAVLARHPQGVVALRKGHIPVMCLSCLALLVLPRRTFGFTLVALFFGGVIAHCALSGSRDVLRRVFEWRPLKWCGTVSYGMYVYHSPILLFMHRRFLSEEYSGAPSSLRAAAVLCGFVVVTIVVATVSWLVFEKQILRWKDRWFAEPDRTETLEGAAPPAAR